MPRYDCLHLLHVHVPHPGNGLGVRAVALIWELVIKPRGVYRTEAGNAQVGVGEAVRCLSSSVGYRDVDLDQ